MFTHLSSFVSVSFSKCFEEAHSGRPSRLFPSLSLHLRMCQISAIMKSLSRAGLYKKNIARIAKRCPRLSHRLSMCQVVLLKYVTITTITTATATTVTITTVSVITVTIVTITTVTITTVNITTVTINTVTINTYIRVVPVVTVVAVVTVVTVVTVETVVTVVTLVTVVMNKNYIIFFVTVVPVVTQS